MVAERANNESSSAQSGPPPSAQPLGGLLLVSLLFMLNATSFFTLNTGMDLYSFYTLDPVSAYPVPAVLSTLLNLIMAAVGYGLYCWLWRRRARFTGGRYGPFTRGAILSFAPVILAHAPAIALTVQGGKGTQIAVAGLMAGSLTVTHALRDPEMSLDPALARYWFIGALAAILTFLCLSFGGMLLLYSTEQVPESTNLLWKYEYEWADLGYPREEFHMRWRNALTAFTILGSGYVIMVLGGSMLGAILRWTREPQHVEQPPLPSTRYQDAPEWAVRLLDALESLSSFASSEAEYSAVFNGYEIDITGRQYERLIGGKDDLLQDVELIVDKVSGEVFLMNDGTWTWLDFRTRSSKAGIPSGPYALLCIYARHPGRRFTNRQLSALLKRQMTARDSLNIRDFIYQLQGREPRIPVRQDDAGSFLDDAVRVCLFDNRQSRTS